MADQAALARLLFGADGSRTVGTPVCIFDVFAPFQPSVHVQGISFRDSDPWFSGNGVFASCDSYKGAAGERGRVSEGDFGHLRRSARQGEVLPERKIRVTFPHENSPKVGVTAKANSHHVVNLPLMPVRRG